MFIGITGRAGSGKTTVANIMKGVLGNTIIHPFAYSLKKFATILGWNGKKDKKGRKLLQTLGTECGRNLIDENLWVNNWEFEIHKLIMYYKYIIIDDVRFENEAEIIRKKKGIIFHVVRPLTCELPQHISEEPLETEEEDILIINNRSIDGLEKTIKCMICG